LGTDSINLQKRVITLQCRLQYSNVNDKLFEHIKAQNKYQHETFFSMENKKTLIMK